MGDPLFAHGIDPWVFLIVAVKVIVAFVVLMVSVLLMIWFERKVISDMQSRIGPNRAGPWGILQTMADGIKLFFKEGLRPDGSDRTVFYLAPYLAVVPAFLIFTIIPIGGEVTVFGHTMTQNHFLYYLTWSIGIVGLGVAWLVVRGRGGRTFRSVRDSEIAAVSSGVNLAWTKTFAFALSGVYAGVAGALYAIQNEIVNPLSFTVSISILLLVGAVVGGLGSLSGLVLGALFVEYLPTLSTHVSTREGVPDFIYGAAIIVVMILLPTGAGGLLRRLARPLTTWLYTRP